MTALTCRLCSVNGKTTAAGRDGLCSGHRSRPPDRGLFGSLGSGFEPPLSPERIENGRRSAEQRAAQSRQQFEARLREYAAHRDSGLNGMAAADAIGVGRRWARERYEPAYAEMVASRGGAA